MWPTYSVQSPEVQVVTVEVGVGGVICHHCCWLWCPLLFLQLWRGVVVIPSMIHPWQFLVGLWVVAVSVFWVSIAATSLGPFWTVEITGHCALQLLSVERRPINFWGHGSIWIFSKSYKIYWSCYCHWLIFTSQPEKNELMAIMTLINFINFWKYSYRSVESAQCPVISTFQNGPKLVTATLFQVGGGHGVSVTWHQEGGWLVLTWWVPPSTGLPVLLSVLHWTHNSPVKLFVTPHCYKPLVMCMMDQDSNKMGWWARDRGRWQDKDKDGHQHPTAASSCLWGRNE